MRIVFRLGPGSPQYPGSDVDLEQRLERAVTLAAAIFALFGLALIAGIALAGWHIAT